MCSTTSGVVARRVAVWETDGVLRDRDPLRRDRREPLLQLGAAVTVDSRS